MPTSIYAALNGQEIRKLTKATLESEIDKLKYLSIGNSFHMANIEFAFTMSAYPADVPVPEKEFAFEIKAASAITPEALKQFNKVESLDNQIATMQKQREQLEDQIISLENLIKEAQEMRSGLVIESEVEKTIDGSIPDKARIQGGLDVPVIETKGGKTSETLIPAVQFKKVSSL